MKCRQFIITLLIALFFTSSFLSGKTETRYITGYIKKVDDNLITLTSNLVWRADSHITQLSMEPVVIVISKDKNEGYLYIKNRRVNVTLMQRVENFGGKQLYTPALNDKLNTYNIGELTEIKSIDKQKGILKLTNGNVWEAKADDDKELLKKWDESSEVIVTKNNDTIIVTNVVTAGFISVRQQEKYTSDQSTN